MRVRIGGRNRTRRGLVVKVGDHGAYRTVRMFDAGRLARTAGRSSGRMKASSDVIVSSGAIAAGIEPLGLSVVPKIGDQAGGGHRAESRW